ncbi:hypothetical protein LEMLEM_LOCUS21998, partial [Lemmus lemmus]
MFHHLGEKAQADPNWKDKNGKTALHHAVLSDVPEIAAALLEPGGDSEESSKHFSVLEDHHSVLEDHHSVLSWKIITASCPGRLSQRP